MPIAPSRIYHVNVNCSDLDRSLAFYTDLVGLSPATRTVPADPQPGDAFGLEQVQWDAWILKGDSGYESPVLDLLEWAVPPPQGEPAADPVATGFNRLGFTTPDLGAMHDRLTSAGVEVWSAPTTLEFERGGGTRLFVCRDPDGTLLEFVEGTDTHLSHIVVNCADLDASRRYYTDVIGLTPHDEARASSQSGLIFGIDQSISIEVARFRDPASEFIVELHGWISPPPAQQPIRKPNDLGIFRMAWVTGDIDRDYAALDDAGVTCYSPPAGLEMGPGIPPLRALFWGDPDGACLELIQPG